MHLLGILPKTLLFHNGLCCSVYTGLVVIVWLG